MLHHQHRLALARPTAALTATGSAYLLTLHFLCQASSGAAWRTCFHSLPPDALHATLRHKQLLRYAHASLRGAPARPGGPQGGKARDAASPAASWSVRCALVAPQLAPIAGHPNRCAEST